ncbi:MAG: hypothetical protein QOD58_3325 [Mycobacterium sp.]|nr:hypothetical protein [Mycobacterium sp.]
MPLKRVQELKPGDRIRMTIGHATITDTQPLNDDRTQLTFRLRNHGSRRQRPHSRRAPRRRMGLVTTVAIGTLIGKGRPRG